LLGWWLHPSAIEAELHDLRDAHPEITERLAILADGRGHPRSAGWRWWTDPHCLTTGWHENDLEAEQHPDWYDHCARPDSAFRDRLEAWGLVIGVVRTAALAAKTVTTKPRCRVR
jgi:hypothetical protein